MNGYTTRSKKKPKFLETNENEHTTAQNLWDSAKAVRRGKFKAIQAYLKRIKIFQINNLILHLQELEEQQQTKPRAVEERNNQDQRIK